MIPSIVAHELISSLRGFIKEGFQPSNDPLHDLIDEFLAHPDSLIKGPYIELSLPFKKALDIGEPFASFDLDFQPFEHQITAFSRLTGEFPSSTLVTTGTGSGKTECFMYPLLEYCAVNHSTPGIKGIVIYPMNALATDQAARFAHKVFDSPNLKHQVRVGLYTGDSSDKRRRMTRESVIESRFALREHPPDILLTNYRMLDLLLMRPEDKPLWATNNPESLRYLVVDELHTFDGAQGTDLACLIRRLKHSLRTPPNRLICIGTSATISARASDVTAQDIKDLYSFAARIFGERFDADSIISETRETMSDFIDEQPIEYALAIDENCEELIDPTQSTTIEEFVDKQYELFFQERIDRSNKSWSFELGSKLRQHATFRRFLDLVTGDDKLQTVQDIANEFAHAHSISDALAESLVNSLCTLIAVARVNVEGKTMLPFLNLKLHVWVRELRRMVARVDTPRVTNDTPDEGKPDEITNEQGPRIQFSDDLSDLEGAYFPLIQCRECRTSGWAALLAPNGRRYETDLRRFYRSFFDKSLSDNVRLLYPMEANLSIEYQVVLCKDCKSRHPIAYEVKPPERCTNQDCGSSNIVVLFETMLLPRQGDTNTTNECQHCGATNALVLFGAQVMTQMSTLLTQLYGTPYNDDRKTIMFSDNVQDAAHRASFVGSRTWRDVMTSAIYHAIRAAGPQRVALDHIVDRLNSQFDGIDVLDGEESPLLELLCRFLPPDLLYLNDYRRIKNGEAIGQQRQSTSITSILQRRLRWETLAQFTFDSLSRRSLERHQRVAIGADLTKLKTMASSLLVTIQEELGIDGVDEKTIVRILLGLLRLMRLAGAVTFGIPRLDTALSRGKPGIRFALRTELALRDFGPVTPTPRYLAMDGGLDTQFFENGNRTNSSYIHWIEDNLFRDQLLDVTKAREVLKYALNALANGGIIIPPHPAGMPAFAIKSNELFITRNTVVFTSQNGNSPTICVPHEEAEYWASAPTLGVRDDAYVTKPLPGHPSYDALMTLLEHPNPTRIRPAEHTALLEQEARNEVQLQFASSSPKPWFPNLISATPTLELGVDIGDLSAVVLCTVPPTPANYVQRAGRAGRSNGNAVTLTTAIGRPHDLYYYSEPQEMLVARIDTPGMYMNAVAVLRRQLTAFCFDTWIATTPGEIVIPNQLGTLLANYEPENPTQFPGNFLRFVSVNAADLFRDFCLMFQNDYIPPETRTALNPYILTNQPNSADSLKRDLLSSFRELDEDLKSINLDIQALDRKIKKLSETPSDDQIKDEIKTAIRDRSGLSATRSHIRSRNLLEFLTTEGILPNYAFPESGIKLRSLIYSRNEDNDVPDVAAFEYVRPASIALNEFAPDQNFYAEARRVQITRIDVSDENSIQDWRLCPVCSYLEKTATADRHTACPSCGSVDFLDTGSKVRMLSLRLVHAESAARDTQIHDDREYREPTFFSRALLPDFSTEPDRRYLSTTSRFSLEYHSEVTFRDINFGEAGSYYDRKVNGLADPVKGFEVCTRCGAVAQENGTINHARQICSSNSYIEQCLYLFREFQSEALRVVLPFENLQFIDDQRGESLIAAMELGLRKRFKGQVNHLRFMISQLALADQQLRWCLVLYDTIPGGTGYIKDLEQKGSFVNLLRLTLNALHECECADDLETDGCYRCVYHYYRQISIKKASRSVAIDVIKTLLDAAERLTEVRSDTVVTRSEIDPSTSIEDLFLLALRSYVLDGNATTVKKTIDRGNLAWTVRANQQIYAMQSEVLLTSSEVAIPCRPDFLLRPVPSNPGRRTIAVFLDGFDPHWKLSADDSAKRLGLVRDGYSVWSFSYKDLRRAAHSNLTRQSDHLIDLLEKDDANLPDGVRKVRNQLDELWGTSNLRNTLTSDPFAFFVQYLRDPNHTQWQRAVFVELLGLLDIDLGVVRRGSPNVARMQAVIPEQELGQFETSLGDEILIGSKTYPSDKSEVCTEVHVALKSQSLSGEVDSRSMFVVLHQRDGRSSRTETWNQAWNAALWLWNRLQFFTCAWWTSEHGLSASSYESVKPIDPFNELDIEGQPNSIAVDEIVSTSLLADDVVRALLKLPGNLPKVGHEWVDQNGKVVAQAELAWMSSKVAVVFTDQFNDYITTHLVEQGWTMFADDDENLIERVKNARGGN